MSKKVSIKQNKPMFNYRKNVLDIKLGKLIHILEDFYCKNKKLEKLLKKDIED